METLDTQTVTIDRPVRGLLSTEQYRTQTAFTLLPIARSKGRV